MSKFDKPVVSVVIPAYNAAQTLAEAVRSCLEQTLLRVEILVVEDGSQDGTAAVMRNLAAEDPRIRPIYLERNGGVARARNTALDCARGDWIAVLDADDHFECRRLARLVEAGSENNADLVADNFYHFDPLSQRVIKRAIPLDRIPRDGIIDVEHFLENVLPRGLTRFSGNFGLLKPMFRRQFLKRTGIRYRPGMAMSEDYQMYLSCLIAGARFILLPDAYYYYHFYRQSVSKAPRITDLMGVIDADQDFMRCPEIRSQPRALELLRQHKTHVENVIALFELKDIARRRALHSLPSFLSQHGRAIPYIMRRVAGRLVPS